MCKYCRVNELNPGEWSNDVQTIGRLKEGHTLFMVMLNRYIIDDENHRDCELILSHEVMLSDGMHDVQQKHIPIKYCPFCGEKL